MVQCAEGERSYHIFYQLCAGAPPALKGILFTRSCFLDAFVACSVFYSLHPISHSSCINIRTCFHHVPSSYSTRFLSMIFAFRHGKALFLVLSVSDIFWEKLQCSVLTYFVTLWFEKLIVSCLCICSSSRFILYLYLQCNFSFIILLFMQFASCNAEKLNLQTLDDYKYLSQSTCHLISGVDDAEQFRIVTVFIFPLEELYCN